jgi:hypothetical protein
LSRTFDHGDKFSQVITGSRPESKLGDAGLLAGRFERVRVAVGWPRKMED